MKETPISSDRLREWSQASAFVFTGRIEAMGSTNLDGVKPEPRMATVQVEEVAVATLWKNFQWSESRWFPPYGKRSKAASHSCPRICFLS